MPTQIKVIRCPKSGSYASHGKPTFPAGDFILSYASSKAHVDFIISYTWALAKGTARTRVLMNHIREQCMAAPHVRPRFPLDTLYDDTSSLRCNPPDVFQRQSCLNVKKRHEEKTLGGNHFGRIGPCLPRGFYAFAFQRRILGFQSA